MNYKKYSLENLENWMHDAMSASEATPQEIYDVIVDVVKDNYYTYKKCASEAYELLALLNGNGAGHVGVDLDYPKEKPVVPLTTCDKDDTSEECVKSWNDFWVNDEYALRESEYYNSPSPQESSEERVERINESLEGKAEYGESFQKTWNVPIEEDGVTGEIYVTFPPEVLKQANISEGDEVEWIDNKNGTYTAKKIEKIIRTDEC